MKIKIKLKRQKNNIIMEELKEAVKQFLKEAIFKTKHYAKDLNTTTNLIFEKYSKILDNKITLRFSMIDKNYKGTLPFEFAKWLVEKITNSPESFYKNSQMVNLAKWLLKVKSETNDIVFQKIANKVIIRRPFRGSTSYIKQSDVGEELYLKTISLLKNKNIIKTGTNKYKLKIPSKININFK